MFQRDDGRSSRDRLENVSVELFLLNGLEELKGNLGVRGSLTEMSGELKFFLEGKVDSFEVFDKYRAFCQLRGFIGRTGQERAQEVSEAYQRLSSGERREKYARIVRDFVVGFVDYIRNFEFTRVETQPGVS